MSLLIAARRVVGVRFPSCSTTRCMSDGIKAFKDRESAQESQFFTQEDNKLLAKLLAKAKEQSKQSDSAASLKAATAERDGLLEILSRYKVSDADIDKVLTWKHTVY